MARSLGNLRQTRFTDQQIEKRGLSYVGSTNEGKLRHLIDGTVRDVRMASLKNSFIDSHEAQSMKRRVISP